MSHVLSIGGAGSKEDYSLPSFEDREAIDNDPVRSFDKAAGI